MGNYIILFFALVFNAVANILLKVGMIKSGSSGNVMVMFKSAIFNPAIVGGIICFVIALGGYCYALSKINLSVAYPIMTSLGYLIVIFASWLFLKESITLQQVIGFALILGGVWLVAVK